MLSQFNFTTAVRHISIVALPGVFNIEAGCYAKCVNIESESDPDMWSAINRFGTVLENVVYDQQQHIVDYSNT